MGAGKNEGLVAEMTVRPNPKMEFKENQTFTQWWLWLILLVILMIPSYGLYQQVYLGEPMGDNPMSNTELIAYFGGTLVFVIGFRTMRLITHITDKQIRIRFFSFCA